MSSELKTPVLRAFDAAAPTYDSLSQVQREVARALVEGAARDRTTAPLKILDLGCGTGHVTEAALARWPGAEIVALDAAPAMLTALREKFPGVKTLCRNAADIDDIGSYDLILSSMALHWLPDPRAALLRWREMLAPGGRLHVALPIEGSLSEWRDACRRIGVTDGLWLFPPPDFAADLVMAARIVAHPSTHASARDFLDSLKRTGARSARPGHRPLSPPVVRRLLATLKGPFTATFRIQYLEVAREYLRSSH